MGKKASQTQQKKSSPEALSVAFDGSEATERAVFADAWAGKTRRSAHFRSWRCAKQGLLSPGNVETITSVTFLSAAEVKNIELGIGYICLQCTCESATCRRNSTCTRTAMSSLQNTTF